jgi:hypothetical protein
LLLFDSLLEEQPQIIITENKLPLGVKLPEHLDANIYGISISLLLFVTISTYHNNKRDTKWNSK